MKTLFIILIFLAGIQHAPAQTRILQPFTGDPPAGRSVSLPDTSVKRNKPWFPGMPRPVTAPVMKPVPPFGTLKISTEIPSIFYYDGDSTVKMTCYHQVTVFKVPSGNHTLSFRNQNMEFARSIQVDKGTTGYYRLISDTTLSDSVIGGKVVMKRGNPVVSLYVPFRHALTVEVIPGVLVNERGFGFSTRLVLGITLARKVKLGVGTGYFSYVSRVKELKAEGFIIPTDIWSCKSDRFVFSFIPLYLNVALNFQKDRSTTVLSFDIGANFPVTRSVTTRLTSTRSGSNDSDYYLKIDRIKPGLFLGADLGWKYFLNPFIEAGFLVGFHANFNDFDGTHYSDRNLTMPFQSNDHSFGSSCVDLNFIVAFHLDTKKLKGKVSDK